MSKNVVGIIGCSASHNYTESKWAVYFSIRTPELWVKVIY